MKLTKLQNPRVQPKLNVGFMRIRDTEEKFLNTKNKFGDLQNVSIWKQYWGNLTFIITKTGDF